MTMSKQRAHFVLALAASLLVSVVLLVHFHGAAQSTLLRGSPLGVEGTRDEALSDSRLDVAMMGVRKLPVPDMPGNATNLNRSLEDQCTPRTSIAFLKMHKCSSSTVQNLLFRYGEGHQLDFVLPPSGNYLGHGDQVFYRGFMMKFPDVSRHNILCHHTRFSHKGMQNVLAKDAVFTTIIRDPVTMYESLFTYLHMAGIYSLPEGKALEMFLEMPDFYYNISHGHKCKARNPMLFDLGLDESLLGDEVRIGWKIEQLKRELNLVMITEYFEESLVLLKHLMCWETDDMVYFILNARSKPSVKPVSPDMAAKIRRWNFGDVALYDAFNQTFWKKIAAFGHDRMRGEVAALRQRNKYFRDHCIARVVSSDSTVWHPPGIDIDSFQLKPEARNDEMCLQMARTELPYSKHIRELQLARYGMPSVH